MFSPIEYPIYVTCSFAAADSAAPLVYSSRVMGTRRALSTKTQILWPETGPGTGR